MRLCKYALVFIISILWIFGITGQIPAQTAEEDKMDRIEGMAFQQKEKDIAAEQNLVAQLSPVGELNLGLIVYRLIFSPYGDLITADESGGIRMWNTKDYSLTAVLEGHAKEVFALSVSPDGKYLASAGKDQLIKIWNIGGKKLIKTIYAYTGTITALDFSPDSTVLASASLKGVIELWAVKDGSFYHVTTLSEEQPGIYSISFYPEGNYLASAGKDKKVRIWPLGVDDKMMAIGGHEHLILDATFSPKGSFLASGGADNLVLLWRVNYEAGRIEVPEELQLFGVQKGWVMKTGFSLDEKYLITAGREGWLRIWRLEDKQLVRVIRVFTDSPVYDFAFSSSGEQLAVAGRESVCIYDWPAVLKSDGEMIENSTLKLKNVDNFPSVHKESQL